MSRTTNPRQGRAGQPVENIVLTAHKWRHVIDGAVLDGTPAAVNTGPITIKGWAALWVLIDINSTSAPTNIRVLPQVRTDRMGNWFDFEEGLWASLYWEDTDTAAGIHKAYLLPVGGMDELRLRVVATGLDQSNYFTVSIWLRAFLPGLPVAHA